MKAISDETNGKILETRDDLRKACDRGKYILVIKRPQSKSRIHHGKCRLLVQEHILDYSLPDLKIGTGKAKQQYFAFDSLKDAKNAYPTHVRIIDPCCKSCI